MLLFSVCSTEKLPDISCHTEPRMCNMAAKRQTRLPLLQAPPEPSAEPCEYFVTASLTTVQRNWQPFIVISDCTVSMATVQGHWRPFGVSDSCIGWLATVRHYWRSCSVIDVCTAHWLLSAQLSYVVFSDGYLLYIWLTSLLTLCVVNTCPRDVYIAVYVSYCTSLTTASHNVNLQLHIRTCCWRYSNSCTCCVHFSRMMYPS